MLSRAYRFRPEIKTARGTNLTILHGMREAGERVVDGEGLRLEQIVGEVTSWRVASCRRGAREGDELMATSLFFAQADGDPSRRQPGHLEAA